MNFILKFIFFYLSNLNNHNNFNSKIYVRKAKLYFNENNLIEISNFIIYSLIENSKFFFETKTSNSFFIENSDDIYEFINFKENSNENKIIFFDDFSILNKFFSLYKYCYNNNKNFKNTINIIVNNEMKIFDKKNEEKIKRKFEFLKDNEINFLFEISKSNFDFLLKKIKNKHYLISINNISIEINEKNYPSKFYVKIIKIFLFFLGIFLIIFHKSKERLSFNNILSTQISIEFLLVFQFIINFIEYLNVDYYENISKVNFYSKENLKIFQNFNNFNIFINVSFIIIKNTFFFVFFLVSKGFEILSKDFKHRKKIFFLLNFCDFFIEIFLWFIFYEQKILFNFTILDFYYIFQNLFFLIFCLFNSKKIIKIILRKIEILRNNNNENIFENDEFDENFLINILSIESYLKKSCFISGINIINIIYNFLAIFFLFIINIFLIDYSNDINKFTTIIINNFAILFLSILFFPKDLPEFYWADAENFNEEKYNFRREFKANVKNLNDLRECDLNEIKNHNKNYEENSSDNSSVFYRDLKVPIVVVNPFENVDENFEYQNLLNDDENAINNSLLSEENCGFNNNNKLINKSIENMKIGFLFDDQEDSKKNIIKFHNNNNNNYNNIDDILFQFINPLNLGEDY